MLGSVPIGIPVEELQKGQIVIGLLLLASAASAEVRGELALTRLPFTLLDNRVFVSVRLNGKGPFAFILDTGAGDGTSVSLPVYKQLGLPAMGIDQMTGAGTGTQSVVKTAAASVALGGNDELSKRYRATQAKPIELGPMPLNAIPLKAMADMIGFTHLSQAPSAVQEPSTRTFLIGKVRSPNFLPGLPAASYPQLW